MSNTPFLALSQLAIFKIVQRMSPSALVGDDGRLFVDGSIVALSRCRHCLSSNNLKLEVQSKPLNWPEDSLTRTALGY